MAYRFDVDESTASQASVYRRDDWARRAWYVQNLRNLSLSNQADAKKPYKCGKKLHVDYKMNKFESIKVKTQTFI